LLGLLDGLPLAIAQAAAFLQESQIELQIYIGFYEQQWNDLMESRDWEGAPLQDYPDRSIWTTWAISYRAIRERHVPTANLLLLWAFLDSKDLWYGLFAAACNASTITTTSLSEWIGNVAINEVEFAKAIQLLRNYSLIEDVKNPGSYATHPVVHRWAYYFQGKDSRVKLAQLAAMIVGFAVPNNISRESSIIRRRLLPHAKACSRFVLTKETRRSSRSHDRLIADNQSTGTLSDLRSRLLSFTRKSRILAGKDFKVDEGRAGILAAINQLGNLYMDQGELIDAEKMYQEALQGIEKALGAEHTLTLAVVNNLGAPYEKQGKLAEAETMYKRALQGYEKAWGPDHKSTLDVVNSLGVLYASQGKLGDAEQMFQRALRGQEKVLGLEHTSTLSTVNNLGLLCADQGKLSEAEQMYQRALQGLEKTLDPEHMLILDLANNLGLLYARRGKLGEAETLYQRALRGYKNLGLEHISALHTFNNLGDLYWGQGKLGEAEKMYQRALQGKEKALGLEHKSTLRTANYLAHLYTKQGRLDEAEKMFQRAPRAQDENGITLPAGWERRKTDQGKTYYVNHISRTTQWASPQG
jgi:tetratricopeptide (TPR) repeat protein